MECRGMRANQESLAAHYYAGVRLGTKLLTEMMIRSHPEIAKEIHAMSGIIISRVNEHEEEGSYP